MISSIELSTLIAPELTKNSTSDSKNLHRGVTVKDLPVKKTEEFLAEVEVMDLSRLKNESFIVAVATGDGKAFKFLGSTVHGPYRFVEMLQEVGDMWATHQHHAKVIVLDKNPANATQVLDENTVDYIECHYNDLIVEEMIGGAFDKEFTCQVGMLEDDGLDPRRKKAEETDAKITDDVS